ncbi:SpoIIE family protein phosphatase [candidate division KSB1 bacterium]|nr:SpoIIE family protein phosphatase [candidate division KSB1 bacterium]NIR71555.1 SpoIIE family protein phosphatase [candidate division KSB1 bacterium]NIS26351.1 SpoIIE family protein phosphatase [candidate division KSB1 bacterium]NIT73118.1 SpoIIE family protein phosphatase [candidate division KSB1 bacterium]NIU27034.1 SpoIIE family protein phosphatase [candidate division KSB1 bacterium]
MEDINKLKKENARLKKTVEDLWTINNLARIISSTMPVKEILDKVVAASLKAVNAQQGTISLLNYDQDEKKGDQFKTLIRKVDTISPVGKLRLNEELSDRMIKDRQPLIINDVAEDKTFRDAQPLSQNIRSILSVPLLCKGELIGVVNVFNKKEDGFSKEDQRLLSIIASQSAQVIENARLYEEEKRLRRIQHELEMARDIQQGLIPKVLPATEHLDIASYFNPAEQVGGDYFDYFNIDTNKTGFVMADVSGHGTSAALVMTMVKGIVHAIVHEFDSPHQILAEINSILTHIGPKDKFITMMFMMIDWKKKKLYYSNAGHNPLLFHDHRSKKSELIVLKGPALGIAPDPKYQDKEMSVNSGDLIFIYTDGIIEAFDGRGDMFEEKRLLKAVNDSGSKDAAAVIEHVRSTLLKFTEKAPQSDDIAMIAVKMK